jgi:hypothetical protein
VDPYLALFKSSTIKGSVDTWGSSRGVVFMFGRIASFERVILLRKVIIVEVQA